MNYTHNIYTSISNYIQSNESKNKTKGRQERGVMACKVVKLRVGVWLLEHCYALVESVV